MRRSTPRVLSEIVAPALQRVLPEDPIARLQLIRCPSPYADRDVTPEAVKVELEVAGEAFVFIAYDPVTLSTAEDARERLVSEMADFVAENRFGWGSRALDCNRHNRPTSPLLLDGNSIPARRN